MLRFLPLRSRRGTITHDDSGDAQPRARCGASGEFSLTIERSGTKASLQRPGCGSELEETNSRRTARNELRLRELVSGRERERAEPAAASPTADPLVERSEGRSDG